MEGTSIGPAQVPGESQPPVSATRSRGTKERRRSAKKRAPRHSEEEEEEEEFDSEEEEDEDDEEDEDEGAGDPKDGYLVQIFSIP